VVITAQGKYWRGKKLANNSQFAKIFSTNSCKQNIIASFRCKSMLGQQFNNHPQAAKSSSFGVNIKYHIITVLWYIIVRAALKPTLYSEPQNYSVYV